MKIDTQQIIIGAIISKGKLVMGKCSEVGMTPDWFTGDMKLCYAAAMDMFASGKPIDSYTIQKRVEGSMQSFVTDSGRWMDMLPTMAHLAHYIESAVNEHKLDLAHEQLQVSQERLDGCSAEAANEVIATIQGEWSRIGVANAKEQPFADVAVDLVNEWKQPKTEAEKNAVLWPTDMLNRFIGPLDDEFIIIGARPSVGKTAFIIQWALMNAQRGVPSAIASLESSAKRVAMRSIAYLGNVNTLDLKRKEASDHDMQKAERARDELVTLPIVVVDSGMTVEQIRAFGMAQKAAGARILFIDNSKHIRPSRKYDSPVQQFRDMSMHCKWIRDDLGIPVVLLHHLNKDLGLSWSDDIERDADIILLKLKNEEHSQQPCRDNNWMGRDIVDWDLKKNREGKGNTSLLGEFIKDTQRFRDYDPTKEYITAGGIDYSEITGDGR